MAFGERVLMLCRPGGGHVRRGNAVFAALVEGLVSQERSGWSSTQVADARATGKF
jgi:hypothetical protein